MALIKFSIIPVCTVIITFILLFSPLDAANIYIVVNKINKFIAFCRTMVDSPIAIFVIKYSISGFTSVNLSLSIIVFIYLKPS